jgi:hypothetical protein
MDQIQQLQQQLALAKARGFDLYQQCEQQGHQIQYLSSMLGRIAHKLGISDLNSIEPDELFSALDKQLDGKKGPDDKAAGQQ